MVWCGVVWCGVVWCGGIRMVQLRCTNTCAGARFHGAQLRCTRAPKRNALSPTPRACGATLVP